MIIDFGYVCVRYGKYLRLIETETAESTSVIPQWVDTLELATIFNDTTLEKVYTIIDDFEKLGVVRHSSTLLGSAYISDDDICPSCGTVLVEKSWQAGGGVKCVAPECGYWFCY